MAKTFGIDIYGRKKKYGYKFLSNTIFCFNENLVELYVAKGVRSVGCFDNHLIKLELPEGVLSLNCQMNQLTRLNLPDSLNTLWCDKDLFDYAECNIPEVHICYPI